MMFDYKSLRRLPSLLIALIPLVGLSTEISQDDLNRSLSYAARQGDMGSFNTALALGASLYARDRDGNNAVLMAVQGRQNSLLRTLLDKGVETDLVGSSGQTPLTAATINGDLLQIRLLLKAGARPDLRNARGESPAHLAVALRRNEILTELIKVGINSDLLNDDGETPLIIAIRNDNKEAFDALLAVRTDVNLKDRAGRPPLFWAVMENHEDMALALTEKGSRIDVKSDGYTPLQLARMMGHQRLLARYPGS